MNPVVLGRDPFSKPSDDAPAEKARPKRKKPASRAKPATRKKPASRVSSAEQARRARDAAAQIDRQELLQTVEGYR